MISKLKTLIEKDGSNDTIETLEDNVVDEIEKFVKEELFYELPKSKIKDVELLCELVSRMCESKGEESMLLLGVIKREEATR